APGAMVRIDGSSSVDADEDSLTYYWQQVDGPLFDFVSSDADSLLLDTSVPGSYLFGLRVHDGYSHSLPVWAQIVVGDSGSQIIMAHAGDDQLAVRDTPITLDARNSVGPEGVALTYEWEQLTGPITPISETAAPGVVDTSPSCTGCTLRYRLNVGPFPGSASSDDINISLVDRPFGIISESTSFEDGPGEATQTSITFSGETVLSDPLAIGAVTLSDDIITAKGFLPEALFVGPDMSEFPSELVLNLSYDADHAISSIYLLSTTLGIWKELDMQSPANDSKTIEVALAHGGLIAFVPTKAVVKDDESCACAGSQNTLWLLLVLLAFPWIAYRRRFLPVLFMALAMVWVQPAYATDVPHDLTTLANGCMDCHSLHAGSGLGLTQGASIAELCMSCHTSGQMASAMPFSSGDQATPGISGTSHRWDVSPISSTYGSQTPLEPLMRLDWDDQIACSTCHDSHSQSMAAFDPQASTTPGESGRHFLRMDNSQNEMCLDCHR
ncbi:hypothetical protein KAI87_17770, partial [Myxococcota bacterium]|nr:hypothetical protein [Myxococcota bacterium]